MAGEYYYLVSSLPAIGTPELTAEKNLDELQSRILEQLSEEDRTYFRYLLYRNDNKNLLYILRKRKGINESPFFTYHKPSAFSYQELEEGLTGGTTLPEYMNIFLRETAGGFDGRITENRLVELYYEEAVAVGNSFLAEYFRFKRTLKNIVSGINSRLFGYDLKGLLVGAGDIQERMLQSSAQDLGLGNSYPFIQELYSLAQSGNYTGLEKKIDAILSGYIDARGHVDPFSSEAVFSWFIKTGLSARWVFIDQDKGREEMNRTIDWVVNSFSLSGNPVMEGVF